MPFELKVLSQQPPGGRCTLYARYAAELSSCFGVAVVIDYTECRDAHGEGFPSLLLNGVALQPSDGVILAPQDIYEALDREGIPHSIAPDLMRRLQAIEDDFLS